MKPPTPPAPPHEPGHGPAVGSYGVAVSYERGNPVHHKTLGGPHIETLIIRELSLSKFTTHNDFYF